MGILAANLGPGFGTYCPSAVGALRALDGGGYAVRAMPPDTKASTAEREQTDESLRAERATTDHVLGEEQVAIDDVADAVIGRARIRADAVLARARAAADERTAGAKFGTSVPPATQGDRAREDRALRAERADADEIVRVERAKYAALLGEERGETDQDLLVERARADHALATRDDVLGLVSHELRGMLNSIQLCAGLLAKHPDRSGTYSERILRSSARMDRLIGDLVDVVSIEADTLAVTLESSDSAEVVKEALENFQAQAAANGVALSAEAVGTSLPAVFDPARILQVLVNLLSNAIKFTPRGGKVSVRVERVAAELRFAVRDSGVGIPEDKLDAVFQRFLQLTRNDRRGLGLGLYISRCIVQGHGGRIWVESTVGEGSTFYFTLPLAAGLA